MSLIGFFYKSTGACQFIVFEKWPLVNASIRWRGGAPNVHNVHSLCMESKVLIFIACLLRVERKRKLEKVQIRRVMMFSVQNFVIGVFQKCF